MDADPVETNPGLYAVVFENERVRVLEYRDSPGAQTVPHHHPDSVMVTLSAFDRRLSADERTVDVSMPSGAARWLDAQTHSGENTGTGDTHVIFIELKEPAPTSRTTEALGPSDG
jgi:hypothetical protein